MGMFIKVKLNESSEASSDCACCVSVCPVDIFKQEGDRIVIVEENEDECLLCGLCIEACPKGAVTIEKLYEE